MRLALIAIMVAGLAARLLLAALSYGTNDVATWYAFVHVLQAHGPAALYTLDAGWVREVPFFHFNHPPPVIGFVWLLARLEGALPSPLVLKLPAIVADLGTALLVFSALRARSERAALGAAAAVLLSPALVLVSGFHGNTDSVLVFFSLAAVLAAERGRGPLAGALVALAVGTKLAGVLVLAPVLVTLESRERRRALGAIVAASALLWAPGFLLAPRHVIAKTLGYAPPSGGYGPGLVLYSLVEGATEGGAAWWVLRVIRSAHVRSGAVLVLLLAGLAVPAARRGLTGVRLAAATTLAFIALAPGVALQYLAWPLGLLALVSPGRAALQGVLAGAFLLLVYLEWSGGTLGFASSWHHGSWNRWETDLLGIASWVVTGAAAVAVARRGGGITLEPPQRP